MRGFPVLASLPRPSLLLSLLLAFLLFASCAVGSPENAQELQDNLGLIASKLYLRELSRQDLSSLILAFSSASTLLTPAGSPEGTSRVTNAELTTTVMKNKMTLAITGIYDFLVYTMGEEQLYETHRILAFGCIAQMYSRLYAALAPVDYQQYIADNTLIFYEPTHAMDIENEEDYGVVFPPEVDDVMSLQRYYLIYFMTELVTDERDYEDQDDPTVCKDMDKDALITRILYWSNVLQVMNYELLASTDDFTERNYKFEMYHTGLPNYLAAIQDCLNDVSGVPLSATLNQYVTDFATKHFSTYNPAPGQDPVLTRLLAFGIEMILPTQAQFVYGLN